MKILPGKKNIVLGFTVCFLVLISVLILLHLNTLKHLENEESVNTTASVIRTAELLLAAINDAESERRALIITNDNKHLLQARVSSSKADSSLAVLKNLLSNDQAHRLLLDSLSVLAANRRLSIEKSYQVNHQSELQQGITRADLSELQRINYIISRIQESEKELFARQLSDSERSGGLVIAFQVALAVLIAAILIWVYILVNRSVNRKRESERALEQSMNRFHTILRSIGDGVIVTNRLGDITFMNPVAQTITGWSETEAKGLYLEHIFNVINEEDRERIENPVSKVLRTGKITRLGSHSLLITKSGTEIPIDDSVAPIVANDGSLMGVILVFRGVSEKRKAERELLRNQKFIQGIAESIPNILYVYDIEGPRIIYANKKLKETLGYTAEEIIKMDDRFLEELIHPDDYNRIKEYVEECGKASGSDVMESELRVKNSHNQWRWLHNYDVVFTRDDEGKPSQIVGTALDVTEKKAMEEELKKYSSRLEETVGKRTSELVLANEKLMLEIGERIKAEKSITEAEEKFRKLVEYSLVGIYIIQDDKLLYTNPKFEQIFGYSSGEMIGMKIYDIVDPGSKEMVERNIRLRVEKAVSDIQYTFKGLRRDGKVIDVEVRGTKMFYEDKLALIGSLNDITERKKAEEELRRSQQRLMFHIQKTPLGVIEWDVDFRVVDWNESAERIFGFSRTDALGKSALEIIVPDNVREQVAEVWKNLLSQTGGTRSTNVNITKAGNEILCEWYNTPLKDLDGRVIGVASLVEDITVRKNAEEILRKSLKEKELLVQEVHHRVKNNLQTIVSLLKLQSRYIHDKRDLEVFNKSRARIETMSLIHEKLYKSRNIQSINMTNYLKDLSFYLLKAYCPNPAEYRLTVNAENLNLGIDTAIPCGLIVNELVANSLKHAFKKNQRGEVNISITNSEEYITLNVCDNGRGFPKGFEIEKSDSLGLQLVRTLTKQLDGEIAIDSSSQGSRFTVRFPKFA